MKTMEFPHDTFDPQPARGYFLPHEVEEDFGQMDADDSWKTDDPSFEWTSEDLEEFERDRFHAEQERLSMAWWWEMEGVRCATFGRDPYQNPYLEKGDKGGVF